MSKQCRLQDINFRKAEGSSKAGIERDSAEAPQTTGFSENSKFNFYFDLKKITTKDNDKFLFTYYQAE